MNSLLSVIVPVYNVEPYVEECIDSIIKQKYRPIEIIVVDDGSTDRSGSIIDTCSERYDEVKVYHKKNGGLSDARNFGVDKSKGDFIAFVDSDDRVQVDIYSSIIGMMIKNEVELGICNYYKYTDSSSVTTKCVTIDGNIVVNGSISRKQLINMMFKERYRVLMPVAWNKVYHRKLFDHIRFPDGKTHEDEFVIHELINLVDEAIFLDEPMYGYRQRSGSIISEEGVEGVIDKLTAYRARYFFYISTNEDEIATKAYQFFIDELVWELIKLKVSKRSKAFKALKVYLRKEFGRLETVIPPCSVPVTSRIKAIIAIMLPDLYVCVHRAKTSIKSLF